MENNKKYLNILKTRKILFLLLIIVMIAEVVFYSLMFGEQKNFENWYDNWIQTKKLDYKRSGIATYGFGKWLHLPTLGLLLIASIWLGINTFSKTKKLKITKNVAGTMASVALLLLVFSVVDLMLTKPPELGVTIKYSIGGFSEDKQTPMTAENKEIAAGFNNFQIFSKKGIILTSLSSIIFLSLAAQSYLVDLTIKKTNEDAKLKETIEEKEYSEQENSDEYYEEETHSEYYEEDASDTYSTI